jgi:hypothetical protein
MALCLKCPLLEKEIIITISRELGLDRLVSAFAR